MDGDGVIVDKWVRGNPAAADFEKVLLVRRTDGRYEVRYHCPSKPARPAIVRPNHTQGLAAAMQMLTADWRRMPADISPPVRYGRR